MASGTVATGPAGLSPADMTLIERLVEEGRLVAVPRLGSAKPRRVVTAALDATGDRILLYLSARPFALDGPAAAQGKPRGRRSP